MEIASDYWATEAGGGSRLMANLEPVTNVFAPKAFIPSTSYASPHHLLSPQIHMHFYSCDFESIMITQRGSCLHCRMSHAPGHSGTLTRSDTHTVGFL